MKLELKHVAPYLPYDLGIKILNYKCDYVGIKESIVNGYYFIGYSLYLTYKNGGTGKSINESKIILRPLSDLTKEIEHNGEKFVPLLVLRDIEQGNWDEGSFFLTHTQITDYGVRLADHEPPCYWVEWSEGLNQKQSFSFKEMDFNRFWIINIDTFGGIETCMVKNQYLLFQKLHEWKFDLYNLIKNNLAIDINTI